MARYDIQLVSSDGHDAKFLIAFECLERIKATYANPSTGLITKWVLGEGQKPTSVSEVRGLLSASKRGNVQMWIDKDEFLISWTSNKLNIILDGISNPRRIQIITALADALLNDTEGFILMAGEEESMAEFESRIT
jgi:hypothetical protein